MLRVKFDIQNCKKAWVSEVMPLIEVDIAG